MPSNGSRKFTGTESTASSRSAYATSTNCSSLSPSPTISPEQGDSPAEVAARTVATRSAKVCVAQTSG